MAGDAQGTGQVYKLRSVLQGHSMDVKQVSVVSEPSGALLTASRDKTARLWYEHEDKSYSTRKVYKGHPKYVSCVAFQDPSDEYPSGLIYTGCQDGKIRAFLPDIEDPLYLLEGHAENVTSLFVGKFGTIISGSWDCTAKVWVNRKCSMTLTGHSFAVWAVAILPEVGIMVTASADKLIKLWKAGVNTHTLSGHTDAVRSLAVISSDEFLSAGNDATVRRWSRTGDCLGTYYGHDNYIYSVAILSSGPDLSWVTSGEDRSVRVWKDNQVVQTIYLPAISVWSVCVLPNGDIAASTNDGCVRVFTNDASRIASPEVQEIFEAELSKVALAAQQELGGVKLTDLPGPEALYEPGARDGQQKMVRQGDKVSVHSWNMAENKWDKIGDVVGAAEQNSGKKLHNGKEYDYVFDIEIDEPKCTLKLPYNLTDSPYMAAQEFIHKHDLSQFYLDEIAQHIVKNTGGQNVGTASGGNFDPLTGGSSYHSEAIAGGNMSGGVSCDPYTGSGAYTSGSGGVITGTQGFPAPEDPWMAGAYRTDDGEEKMDTTSNGVISNKYFPQQEFLYFDSQVKPDPVIKKLKEFNALVPEEQRVEEALLEQLPSLTSSSSPDPSLISTLLTLLKWPDAQTFPALDILRSALLNISCQPLLIEKSSLDEIFSACLRHVEKTSPVNSQMLALRCLANLFHSEAGQTIMRLYRDSVISRIMEKLFPIVDNNKNIETGAATVMMNYAVSLQEKFDDETQVQVMSVLGINFLSFISDWEARFRVLVTLGTIMASGPEALDYAKTLEIKDGVRSWRLLEGSAKVTECAQFIENIL